MGSADRLLRQGRRAAVGLALLAAGLAALSAPASAKDPIIVTLDQAKLMRISRPASTIIIGNPAIADATIQDNQNLILTGKSYGSTNLIILDADGKPIVDELLVIQPTEDAVVTVFRRASRQTLSCAPICGPTVTLGDNEAAFSGASGQVQSRQGLSTSLGN